MNLPAPPRAAAASAALAAAITCTACTACTAFQPRPAAPAHPRPAAARTPHCALFSPDLAWLLPFSPARLRAAAALAARFAAAYDTYNPRQPPAAWLARLRPMAAPLAAALARTAATPALWQHHHATTARAATTRIRDLTPGMVILTVRLRHAAGSPGGPDLAVTLIPRGSTWAVYDIEPAGAGNTG